SKVRAEATATNPVVCEYTTSKAVFSRGGRPLQPGEILYQRDLGRTFQDIIDGGKDAFYRGKIARSLVTFSEEQEGLLTEADFAQCRSRWAQPIATSYPGYTAYSA